jgi:hypothetical protein
MNNKKTYSSELFIFCVTLVLAFLLRFVLLGKAPLAEREATLAFQAWQIWVRDPVIIGSQVGYLSITKALFSIFGSGNFLARFWPAFTGSALVLTPILMRKKLGKAPALVLAVGLALDPALVSASRIVGSPVPALVFLLLTLAAFHLRQIPLAITLFVLGLFSGPGFWLGLIIVVITFLVSAGFDLYKPKIYFRERLGMLVDQDAAARLKLIDFALPALSIVTVGSFFFSQIRGLSSWPGALSEFIISWTNFPVFKTLEVLIHLGASNPLIIIFGALGFYTSWKKREKVGQISSIWFITALVILLIYPGRQPFDLIWVVFPLWVGAARELVRLYKLVEGSWPHRILAGLISVLLTLNWLTFVGMVFQIGNQQAIFLQWGLMAASLALTLLAMTITASEWGWPTAIKGITLGTAGMLFLFAFSATIQGAFLRAGDPRSIWSDGSGTGQMDLLLDTIGDVSISQTGRWDSIQGTVLAGDDSLRWLFRELENFEFVDTYDSDSMPPVLITTEWDQELVPQDYYRGQDFVIRTRSAWPGLIPTDWISWIAFRDGPIENEYIILWVRGDILSGEK